MDAEILSSVINLLSKICVAVINVAIHVVSISNFNKITNAAITFAAANSRIVFSITEATEHLLTCA